MTRLAIVAALFSSTVALAAPQKPAFTAKKSAAKSASTVKATTSLAALKAEHRATEARSRAAWAAYDPYASNPVVGAMRVNAQLVNAAIRLNPFAQMAMRATTAAVSVPLMFSPLGYGARFSPLGY